MKAKAILTVTQYREIQYWFHEGHDHDDGATSQKLGFLPVGLNNQWFGSDSFAIQGNRNRKV